MAAPAVTLVIPCYDEEAVLPHLVSRLSGMREIASGQWDVVFVNDGSRDATLAGLRDIQKRHRWARVVDHGVNRGLGAALRTGFSHAQAPVICTMDSDCTFAPERLPEMVEALGRGYDLVTASPWHPQSERAACHPIRRLLSKSASAVYRLIVGKQVHSFTPLHRAYRREVIERVPMRADGFSATAEILIRSIFEGFRVAEIPMKLHKRQYGKSKINILDSIMAHLSLMRLVSRSALAAWWVRQEMVERPAVWQ